VIVFLKGNAINLSANLSRDDFSRLAYLHKSGEIHVSISVSYGERCGFISFDDVDIEKTTETLNAHDDRFL